MMMNYKKVAGAGIAAVTLSLMSTAAFAATITPGAGVFATQAIGTTGAISIPQASAPGVATTAPTSTGSFLITYTLPTGVTFTATPTLGAVTTGSTGGVATATFSAGGVGSNTVTYSVNVSALGTGTPTAVTLTFSSALAITGATALATPNPIATSTFKIGEQITGSSVAGVANETTVTSGVLAGSANALTTSSGAAPFTLNVDITTANINGTKFLQNGADSTVADDGSFTFTIGGALNASGTTFAFTSTTLTETYTGATGGLSAAYLSGNNTCGATTAAQAAITGSIAGTISGSGIVFAGIPVSSSTTARELCLYTAGTSLLAANPVGFTVTTAIDTTSVVAPGVNSYVYNGNATSYPYAVNTSASYASYIRITNKSSTTPAIVTATVISDQGGIGVVQVESALPANGSDLVPMSTITTNAGVPATSGRYSITLFGPASLGFENLLLNPGGVVTQLQ